MKLKEAFRYQNVLKNWIDLTEYFLMDKNNVVKIRETHKKNLVNNEVEVAEIKEINNRKMDVEPNIMINFLYDLVKEKNTVSHAISQAKRNYETDLDCEIEVNKANQRLARVYKSLSNMKNGEKTRQDRAFKFNVEGNQVQYFYDVDEVITIDYDRNKVRELNKKLEKESDVMSMKIEEIQLNMEVNHIPKYDVNDSFEILIESLTDTN